MDELKLIDLTIDNLFDFCSVLDAIGIEQISALFTVKDRKEFAGKDSKTIGLAIGLKACDLVIKSFPKMKNELYQFFAGCLVHENGSSVTAEEVGKIKIVPFMKLIREFFAKDDLTDFFKEVAEFVGLGTENSQN